MTKSYLPDVDRCLVVLRGDTLYDFGVRLDVYIEAEVHGLYNEDQKEAIHLPVLNTLALTAHLTALPVSLIGEGIVVMGDCLMGERRYIKNSFNCI